MSYSDIIQMFMLIASAAAIIVSAFMSKKSISASMRMVKEQNQIHMFAEYTKRYQEIIVNMPKSVYESGSGDEVDFDVLRYMQLYFNLCSEEYDLWTKGAISPDVWEKWLHGIRMTMKRPVYRKAWSLEKDGYSSNAPFIEFMEACISQ